MAIRPLRDVLLATKLSRYLFITYPRRCIPIAASVAEQGQFSPVRNTLRRLAPCHSNDADVNVAAGNRHAHLRRIVVRVCGPKCDGAIWDLPKAEDGGIGSSARRDAIRRIDDFDSKSGKRAALASLFVYVAPYDWRVIRNANRAELSMELGRWIGAHRLREQTVYCLLVMCKDVPDGQSMAAPEVV